VGSVILIQNSALIQLKQGVARLLKKTITMSTIKFLLIGIVLFLLVQLLIPKVNECFFPED
jgi:hypothetical protein